MMIQPPSVLVAGPPGGGKTTSLITLLLAGVEVFVICTEPSGVSSLVDAVKDSKKMFGAEADINKLHWVLCPPSTGGLDAITSMTTEIGEKTYQQITDSRGIGKGETREAAMKFLNALKNFVCERDGKSYGSFTQWGENRALVVDSFSGLSDIAWMLAVGYKPTAMQGEWNIAMNYLKTMVMTINGSRKCWFILTAHVEKEIDTDFGGNKLMVSTLGRKLAPKIPKEFDEFVRARREFVANNPRFFWSTIDNQMDLKNRGLPISNDLKQDFRPLVDVYHERMKTAGGVATPVVVPLATSTQRK